MDAQMDAAIKKTEIYMELNHNKKEILTRQETWGPFNSIRSVKTVGRRVSYHTYKVLYECYVDQSLGPKRYTESFLYLV